MGKRHRIDWGEVFFWLILFLLTGKIIGSIADIFRGRK